MAANPDQEIESPSRRAFMRTVVVGGASAAALAATGLSPNDAKAQQTPTNINFGQHDVRGESEAGIVTAAAHSSVNGVTLLVRTTNQQVWPVAFQTAQGLAHDGYNVSLVLSADGPDRFDIYAGSVEFSQISNPGSGDGSAAILRQKMIEAYNIAFPSGPRADE